MSLKLFLRYQAWDNILLTSIYNRDYTVILGVTIFYSVIVIVLNMVVDLLYPLLDPRIKIGEEKGE